VTSVSADAVPRFVARSEPIDDPGDLLDHAEPGGFVWLNGEHGFVTAGVAARMHTPVASRLFAGLTHERAHGAPDAAGPRLVGALPFEGGGELVLPARIVARDCDGRAWRTTIVDVDVPPSLHVTHRAPQTFTVGRQVGPDVWRDMLERTLAAIDRGDVQKVVLARDVEVDADEPFDVVEVLRVLRATQPGCTVYGVDGFLGASPELLLRRRGRSVCSRPMAGTGDDPDALLSSAKDAHEHRIVVDAIAEVLRTVCLDVSTDGPAAMRFASITHLATTIQGRLSSPDVSALDLVARLHPTPAVGGAPADAARALIRSLEGRVRGRYAGACGWMDAHGDGEFVVALRCAEVTGRRARLFAGAGIVAGSEPAAEWEETQAKLQPMLRALVRP
jgi:menaquinone-specific isochorismate synthase